MQTFDFLAKAQKFCEDNGDGNWFRQLFTDYRNLYSIKDSVWYTLAYLYTDEGADQFFDKHWS